MMLKIIFKNRPHGEWENFLLVITALLIINNFICLKGIFFSRSRNIVPKHFTISYKDHAYSSSARASQDTKVSTITS
jgi:hypothetical protein